MLAELLGVDPLEVDDLCREFIFSFVDPPLEADREEDGRGTGFGELSFCVVTCF